MATPEDVGKPCPYCRFPLKERVPVHACESCGSVHHAECWADGGGCAVFGCAAAGTAAVAAQAPAPVTQAYAAPAYQAAPQAPTAYAPPPPPPYQQPAGSSGMRPWTIALAALVGLAGIAAGVAVASGGLSSSGHHAVTVVTVHQQTRSSTSMSSAEEQQKREAVVGVLDAYQSDYTNHSASGLGSIFTEKVKRHGLSGSGCSVVEGRQPVLEVYEQQFNEGTGTYTLVGLAPNQVQLSGPDSAEVHSHYEISPGGSGFVNFKLAANGNEWKISEVYATCG